jgi:hypothetical protein
MRYRGAAARRRSPRAGLRSSPLPTINGREPKQGRHAHRRQHRERVYRFSKMTCSVVAVVTDVRRDGRPVIGFEAKADLYAVMKTLLD